MPSYARKHQLSNSIVYHIFNRSNARAPIFNNKGDYRHFIGLLRDYKNKFNFKIYHWGIMPNHYHLLLEIEEPENISRFMAGLGRAYTHYYHRVYSTSGFLWQGRFKMQPVQKENYLIRCGRYIERNPVKAGIVDRAENYAYSSARFYCFGEPDGIASESPAFTEFGNDLAQRQNRYREFLQDFNSEEEKSFENLENPQGDVNFVKKLIKRHGHFMPRRRGWMGK